MTYGFDATGAWRDIVTPQQTRELKIRVDVNEILTGFGIPSLFDTRLNITQLHDNMLVPDVYRIRGDLCTRLPEAAAAKGLILPDNWKERIQGGIDADMAREQDRNDNAIENRGMLETCRAAQSLLREVVAAKIDSEGLRLFPPRPALIEEPAIQGMAHPWADRRVA